METKIIQLTAGRGPAECSWVVAKVLKIFLKEIVLCKIDYIILQREIGTENGTIQSVTIQLKGKKIDELLKNWLGTIQWVGTSTFRKYHKRKNWFIGCFEIEESIPLSINENEIKFQAIRSSGPGGQHVNKVSSAIRATHFDTGIQVLVMESRSQHQNKKIAKQRLQEKVLVFNTDLLSKSVKNQWENHLQLERGNPIQVFTGTDFKRKKQEKSYKTKRNQLKNELRKNIE